jgi:carbon-monoxide dehydrogenase medium subunit
VAIGALTRHHDVNTSGVLASQIPLLAHAAGQVGDPQIRHRGTIGGSVAHADAASDLPAVLLALDAVFVIRGDGGASRSVPATEFFKSIFETDLAAGELLTEIQVPKPAAPGAWSFQKFTKRAIDWAIVGVAVQGGADGSAKVALINMGLTPLRASAVESALASGASIADAAALAAEGTSPGSDLHASASFREHLARVLVRRALEEARDR